MQPSSMIELRGLRKEFPGADVPAVAGLDLDVNEGETVVLVGPSGCGKTTTLKMINRLIEPTAGSISIAGRDVLAMDPTELRRSIGYVIQQIGLFPHRTIAENIATVPRLLAWDDARIARRVEELVELVDLDRIVLDRYPPELSGGQRQRVGVARALAADPPILLMDEPFGAVDPIVRAKLQRELRELQTRLRKTIVLVTHDIDEAILLGDRVALLNVGGRLEQFDSPSEILRSPATGFVADFLGKDRGIKRLSLIPLSTVPLTEGPVVSRSSTTAEAERVMDAFGVDWVAVIDDGVLLGWMAGEDFARSDRQDDDLLPFATTLDITDSLKEALDAVVTSHTSVAAVYDGDRYVGMVTIDAISAEIVQ